MLAAARRLWPTLPGREKDYIASPKANGYRSLHATALLHGLGGGGAGSGGAAPGGPSLHPAPPARLLPTIPPLQDVLKFYGATKYGSGPPALGSRSPRESFNPSAPDFLAERGSYQAPAPHP